MLPSVVAREVIEGIAAQLKSQFPSTTPGFHRVDDANGVDVSAIDLLTTEPKAIFKGPYLTLGLPFRVASADSELPFTDIEFNFRPYSHQVKAFQRLAGESPQSTLIATGTGSGKTECFMLPILDYCACQSGAGIKALIIYPMNALAQDQAKRFATEIYDRENLRGKVRVGLFTGDSETSRHTTMKRDWVITSKNTLRQEPPDVLLTNYKMLDYLLIRPRDWPIWQHNMPGSGSSILRYLVVDELHTFDGAQGTDLACLIRRIRDRLGSGDELACIGTSATVGDDSSALIRYASDVFYTEFDEQSVLREERVTADEFLPTTPPYTKWPDAEALNEFRSQAFDSSAGYLIGATKLWFDDDFSAITSRDKAERELRAVAFGEALKAHEAFQSLVRTCSSVADTGPEVETWAQRFRLASDDAALMFESLVALTSVARSWRQPDLPAPETHGTRPLVDLRTQLWLRELRRMVASVSSRPEIKFADDLPTPVETLHLPVAHCRECHSTGWVATKRPNETLIGSDLAVIYNEFFGGRQDACVIYPKGGVDSSEAPVKAHREWRLCSRCRILNTTESTECKQCNDGEAELVPVYLPDMTRQHQTDAAVVTRFHRDCPYCESPDSLFILGSRAATLSSVAVERLFNSHANDDRKLIAFSDSVQDAAHRAGFFEARTYRDVIRKALVGIVNTDDAPGTLDRLVDEFGPRWRARFQSQDSPDEGFVATFLPPDLQWLRDWDVLQDKGALPKGSTLVEQWLLPRLRWEVLSEFGLRSRIGRTAERTGQAVVYPDVRDMQRLTERVTEELREEIGELRSIPAERIAVFLRGIIWRLRTRGALFDDEILGYIAGAGDAYYFRRRQYFPKYGRHASLPAFLTMRRLGKRFDYVVSGRGKSWYQIWFEKTLAPNLLVQSSTLEQTYNILIRGMLARHLIEEELVRGQEVWGLRTSSLLVTSNVRILVCDRCKNRLQVASAEFDLWNESPCLRANCMGLHRADGLPSDVQKARSSVPVRLVTAEHSALLPPETRARVEKSFKEGKQLWDINLLSATPTMEMGVDIGDLSSVMLCSVPPAQANYLQRIGRAGRKDGNAFNLTIATGVPHDLYFFADPLEMMAGEVQPPGVFLKAIAVLERQLIAYCFDQWVMSGVDDSAIPGQLGTVLNAIKEGNQEKFPGKFIRFVLQERPRLLRDFKNLFPDLDEEGGERLEGFLFGDDEQDEFTFRMTNRLHQMVEQRDSLRSEVDALKREVEKRQALPQDEARDIAIEEMTAERNGLLRLISGINRRYTLNFFTDEGLLPNYAFPEEGVRLNSVIFRRREKSSEVDESAEGPGYERISFDIMRPAHAALSELAPLSRFYGNSHQIEIDQVDLKTTEPEEWRLCDRCHYAANVTLTDTLDHCPRCGSHGWRDGAQKQVLLKLKQVFANASDRDSRIADDADDREPIFFNRQSLVDISEGLVSKAYQINDPAWPFGFEYLRSATFREVNFGEHGAAGPEVSVAGNRARRPGFPICKHCGKVRKRGRRAPDNHTYRCPMRDADLDTQKENTFEALYLYRELQSEAIRILLPLSDIALSEVRLQSFVATLHLGLRKFFRGSVDHLQIMHYSEPVGTGDSRRFYLVLMDTVPGGTGYLKELLEDSDNIKRMLQTAQHVLLECLCQHDPDKDGCYRCLYAYRESRKLEETSRKSALEIVNGILERWSLLEKVDGLQQTNINALIESELEQAFIEVLSNQRGCNLAKQSVAGKPGYILSVRRGSGGEEGGKSATRWSIEPQADIGKVDGVIAASRPDFLFRPLSESEDVRPIAVFMDGFEYHKDIVADDTRKRFALMRSDKYRVWSLNWHDLPRANEEAAKGASQWLGSPLNRAGSELFGKFATALGGQHFSQMNNLLDGGPFQWLIEYLTHPVEAKGKFSWFAHSRLFGVLDPKTAKDSALHSEIAQKVGTWLPVDWQEQHIDENSLVGAGSFQDSALISAVGAFPKGSLSAEKFRANGALCTYLNDADSESEEYKAQWQTFWGISNLLQFCPNFLPSCRKGIEQVAYVEIIEAVPTDVDFAWAVQEQGWKDAIELTGSEYREALLALSDRGIPAPEVGFELTGSDDSVSVELEWAWPSQKVGLLFPTQSNIPPRQWKVVRATTESDLNQLVQWLQGSDAGD